VPETCFLVFPIVASEQTPQISTSIEVCLVLVSVLEQRVLLVSLDGALTEASMNESAVYRNFAKFYLMLSNLVVLNDLDEIDRLNKILIDEDEIVGLVNTEIMQESALEFLHSLEGDEYLKLVTMLSFLFYEPAEENFDIDSLKKNLAAAEFEMGSALRIISNVTSNNESMQIEQNLEEFADMVMQQVQQLTESPEIQVVMKICEQPQEPEEILQEISEQIAILCDPTEMKPNIVYGIDVFTPDEADPEDMAKLKRAVFYLVIQSQAATLLYLDTNDMGLNALLLEQIQTDLASYNITVDVYFETVRHAFISDNADVFTGIYAQLLMEIEQTPVDVFRIMAYNPMAFTMMLADDGGPSGGIGGGVGGEGGSGPGYGEEGVLGESGEGDDQYLDDYEDGIDDGFDDNFDDFDDMDNLPG
jgi:hypothetical protein